MSNGHAAGASRKRQPCTQEKENLLDQIITETRIGRDDEQREQSRRQIATLVEEVMKGTLRVSKDLEATINARIADIDALLSKQLNEIMHAPEFPEAGGVVARVALSRAPERDQHDAQDPGAERVARMTSARTWNAPSNSIRARCSRKSTKKSTARLAGRHLGR